MEDQLLVEIIRVYLPPDTNRLLSVADHCLRSRNYVNVVVACAGDVPTLEVLAATDLLRRHLPELKVRVVNVVDLMRLQPATEHPHGMSDRDYGTVLTVDRPVIFASHGYPWPGSSDETSVASR
jgi:xylulose-5-phosphate/fructose-6-phosphate phosphoketolase